MLTIAFSIVIVLFSVVVHEVSHGYMALALGDPTAKYERRLTLNPLRHIDPVGSILVPIVTSLLGFTIGWAKPVPFNPYNLKNRRLGEALVAAAGPASNLAIAGVFSALIRLAALGSLGPAASSPDSPLVLVSALIVIVNISLAVFNLVPIAPLDGSKILFAVFPRGWAPVRAWMERYQIFLVFFFVFFLWQYVAPIVGALFSWFTGARLGF